MSVTSVCLALLVLLLGKSREILMALAYSASHSAHLLSCSSSVVIFMPVFSLTDLSDSYITKKMENV